VGSKSPQNSALLAPNACIEGTQNAVLAPNGPNPTARGS
jgi:hypothetical protein